jgi:hypothetical protein
MICREPTHSLKQSIFAITSPKQKVGKIDGVKVQCSPFFNHQNSNSACAAGEWFCTKIYALHPNRKSSIASKSKVERHFAPKTKNFPRFKATFKAATRFRPAEVTERLACRTAIKWSASPTKRVHKSIAEIDRLKILRRKAERLCPPDPPHCNIHPPHLPCVARRSHNSIFFSDLTPDLDSL